MDKKEDVGFLESNEGRKSSTRLTVIICAFICVFAALVEGTGELLTAHTKDVVSQANWTEISYLVGTLLFGSTIIKGMQGYNAGKYAEINKDKKVVNE